MAPGAPLEAAPVLPRSPGATLPITVRVNDSHRALRAHRPGNIYGAPYGERMDDRIRHHPIQSRRRGSSASRTASPSRLKAMTTRKIVTPGKMASQGAWLM